MSKAVKKVTKAATNVVSKTVKAVSNTVSNVIKNPLPVIETIAVTAIIAPYVAPAVASLGGKAVAQAAAAESISAAAVKAMNGGSVGDIATAAITAGAGSAVGGAVGPEIAKAADSRLIGQIAASATGASTSVTLNALSQGVSLQESLNYGLQAGVVAGATRGTVESIAQTVEQPAGTGLKVPGQVSAPSQAGEASISRNVPGTAPEILTGTGIAASPTALLTRQLAPYSTQLGSVISGGQGTVQPRYTSAADIITPPSLQQYLPDYQPPSSKSGQMTRGLSDLEKEALGEVIGGTYASLFSRDIGGAGPRTTYIAAEPTKQTPLPVGQYAPGSQALAQALRIGDVGAPIFGSDEEKGKKAGWNVESLRYMGDVGEA